MSKPYFKEIMGSGCLSCRKFNNCKDRKKKCNNYKPIIVEVKED